MYRKMTLLDVAREYASNLPGNQEIRHFVKLTDGYGFEVHGLDHEYVQRLMPAVYEQGGITIEDQGERLEDICFWTDSYVIAFEHAEPTYYDEFFLPIYYPHPGLKGTEHAVD